MEGAVSQKIIYDFQFKNEQFANQLAALYQDMNRIAGGAERVGKAIRSTASDSSGMKKFANAAEHVNDTITKMNASTKDSEKSVRQLSKEVGTLLELSRRLNLTRLNDPTADKAVADLQAQISAKQKLIVASRTQAAEQIRANQASREALRIAERHNDQLMTMMKRAAAVAASYLSIQQGAKAVKVGVDFNMMLEQNEMAFKVMLKSQSMATSLISDLRTIQTQTGIGIREGADSAKQLLAYGFQYDGLIKNMTMLKTVAGAVNVPLQDIVYVYGTLRSQGRAYTRDIMQFAMRGIPIYEALAQTMGVSTSQIKKLTEEGAVGFAQVEKAMQFMTSSGGPFGGMMEARMATLAGKTDLLGKQFESTMGAITEAATPAITAIVEELTLFLQKMDTKAFGASIGQLFKNIAAGLPSLVTATAAFFKTVTDGMSAMVKVASTLMPVISALAQILGIVSPLLLPMLAGGLIAGGAGKAIGGIGGALSVAAFTSGGRGPLSAMDRSAALELGATGGFKNAMNNVKEIMGNMMKSPFFSATAWGVAVMGVVALFDAIDDGLKRNAHERVLRGFSGSAAERASATNLMLANEGFVGGLGVSHVQHLAKVYNLSLKEVATALYSAGKVSTSVFESLTKNVGITERGSQMLDKALPAWQGIYDLLNGTEEQLKALRGAEGSGNSKYGYGANAFTDYGSGRLRADVVMENLPRQTDMEQAGLMQKVGLSDTVVDATMIPALESQIAYVLDAIKKIAEFAQRTGTSENVLLQTLGQQYDMLEKQLIFRKKNKTEDMLIERELAAQLSKNKQDDIEVQYAKKAVAYEKQAMDEMWSSAKLANVKRLNEQLMEKELSDYRRELYIQNTQDSYDLQKRSIDLLGSQLEMMGKTTTENEHRRNISNMEIEYQSKLESLRAITEFEDSTAQQLHQDKIAMLMKEHEIAIDTANSVYMAKKADPFLWAQDLAKNGTKMYQQTQGSLFSGAGDALRLGMGQIPFIGRKLQEANWGPADAAALSAGGDLGSAALQGAGGLAMAGGTAGVSMLMAVFQSLTGVIKIFETPLKLAADTLGWFSEAITYVIEPLQSALVPVLNLLKPVMAVFAAGLQLAAALLIALTPAIQTVGSVLTFLSDWVLVPLTNFFIMMTNAVISFINIFRDNKHDLEKVPYAKTTKELEKLAKAAEKNAELLKTQEKDAKKYADMTMDALEYYRKRIRTEADKQIDAYKTLFEVGAISGKEYNDRVKAINDGLKTKGMGGDYANDLINQFLSDWDTSLESMLTGIDGFAEEAQKVWDAANAKNFDPVTFNAAKTALEGYTAALTRAADALLTDEEKKKKASADADAAAAAMVASIQAATTAGTAAGGKDVSGTVPGTTTSYNSVAEAQAAAAAFNAAQKAYGDAIRARWSTLRDDYKDASPHNRKADKFKHLGEITAHVGRSEWDAADALLKAVGYRVGTPKILEDQMAMVHKGEGIVPETFMSAISSGKLTLGGPSSKSGGESVTIYVTVQGHVSTENGIADDIARTIATRQRSGALKVRLA